MKLLKLIPDNTNIDFMRWRNIGLAISIFLTISSLTLVMVRGLNLGVDFVGGQMIRATFPTQVNVEQLRSDVGRLDLGDASIQESGGPTSYQIRLPKPEGGEAAANRAASQVRGMLTQKYPGARIDAVETLFIRRAVTADGKVDREEVEFLLDLRRSATHVHPDFNRFLYKILRQAILRDGAIAAAEVEWLRKLIFANYLAGPQ